MSNTLSKIIITFAAGAAVGSAVSCVYFKTKYERITNEEIESVKEMFTWKHTGEPIGTVGEIKETDEGVTIRANLNDLDKTILSVKKKEKADRAAAKDICEKAGYANYDEEKGNDEDMDKPYVIPPEEFGELDGYSTVSLNYYADKVLTDDCDNVIDDIDDIVGIESLNHFGEYEDDSVFVRNDRTKCDYEILLDVRKFSDICD